MAEDPGDAIWYLLVDGETSGPATLKDLVEEIRSEDLDDRDLLWREGMEEWAPLPEVPEVIGALMAQGIPGPMPPENPDHDPSLRAILPVGRTGLSIAAGYLGVVSLILWPAGVLAIPLGIIALLDLRRKPGKLGAGRAIFAIVAGAFGLLSSIVVVVAKG